MSISMCSGDRSSQQSCRTLWSEWVLARIIHRVIGCIRVSKRCGGGKWRRHYPLCLSNLYCCLMFQVLAHPVPCWTSLFLPNLITPPSPIYLSTEHRNTTGPFPPPPQPVNHLQRRRGNHQSPRRGKRKQSHQRGIKDPSHHVGVTGENPDPGALQRRRDQGETWGFYFILTVFILLVL